MPFALPHLPPGMLEWQAVFSGMGTAFVRFGGRGAAACLLLHGDFPHAETAAIEALEQTLSHEMLPALRAAFRSVRRDHRRPLVVIVPVAYVLDEASLEAVRQVMSCLACAFFNVPAAEVTIHTELIRA